MAWIGIMFLVIAIASFVFGLYVSFCSEGGAIGQVPVLADAVMFPILLTLSFVYLRRAGFVWAKFPVWILLAAFPVIVFLSGILIVQVGNLGERYHRRKK
jgi:hypothetical protein